MGTIQAILCCAMYSLRSAYGASIWGLSGVALRQCVRLGYHRNLRRTKQGPLKVEMAKRCFWVSYDMDRAAGVTLGRPFCIADKDIDVEYPLDIDDSSIGSNGVFGEPRTSVQAPSTSMSCAIHIYKLRQIWSKIHETIYSQPMSAPINFGFADAMRHKLEVWHETTPDQVQTGVGGHHSVFSSKEWFSIAYNHTVLLIYRRHLNVSDPGTAAHNYSDKSAGTREAVNSAFITCSNAGREICLLYRHLYISSSVIYSWGSLHMLFLGGLTYLHTLWASTSVRRVTRRGDVYTTCTACTMVLEVIAERWKAAVPYRDMFETLAIKTITMMCDNDREALLVQGLPAFRQPWMIEQPETEQSLRQLDWEEWIENVANTGMCEGVQSVLNGFLGDRGTNDFQE